MAYITQPTGNYVKFIRGTPTAWENFANKNKDTLYFIAESNATTGKLYLGDVLISGGDSEVSLANLQDIAITTPIYNNSLLMYDSESGKWENQPLGEVLSALEKIAVNTMTGASETVDGVAGLVPAPTKGQQNLFLRGDATWADPTTALSAKFDALYDDTNNKNSIRNVAAEEIAKVVASAPEAYDTLKEIADWIAGHEEVSDLSKLNARLTTVESTLFDTAEEKDAEGNVTKEATIGLVTTVANLDSLINDKTTGLTVRVEKLEENLTWGELVAES